MHIGSQTIVRFVLLVGLYVLCTWFAEAFIKGPAQVTIFWPAAGVAYAAVLRYGWRWSLFIPVSVVIAHGVFVPVPDAFLTFSITSNLLGSLAGAYVALAGGMRPDISVASGFAMLRGAIVMVLVSAIIGSIGLVYSEMVPPSVFWPAAVKWSMGDLLGILCVAPTMLLLTAPPSSHPDLPPASDYATHYENAGWAVSLLLSYVVVFVGGQQDSYYALGMVALPLSILLWSAFRFQPIWTAAGTGASVVFLTSLTGLGLAGFRPPIKTLDAALLLGFMTLFAVVPLALAASMNQHRISVRRMLRQAIHAAAAKREELERLVSERTRQLHESNQLLATANVQLETASLTDPLTGLRNRRYLSNQIPADLSFYDRERVRTGKVDALVFALVDIDHFKSINDRYGHAAGDQVLQQLSGLMTRLVRVGDYVVRWGGEEFLLVFRPVSREYVPVLGERIRHCVENHAFDIGDGVTLRVTCSIGIAEYPLFCEPVYCLGWEQMVELADAALYWVKNHGRNGWAALRPTDKTDPANMMSALRLGAQPMIDSGHLGLIASGRASLH